MLGEISDRSQDGNSRSNLRRKPKWKGDDLQLHVMKTYSYQETKSLTFSMNDLECSQTDLIFRYCKNGY